MTITAEAIFQNGQLRLTTPLQIPEGTVVRLTLTPLDQGDDPLDAVIGIGDSGLVIGIGKGFSRTSGDDGHGCAGRRVAGESVRPRRGPGPAATPSRRGHTSSA